ncbi:MAG: hypothetical protein LBJ07_04400 [Actinomycetes bacterium]|nr:hypothetical protein [Actinomycetes bacterium]
MGVAAAHLVVPRLRGQRKVVHFDTQQHAGGHGLRERNGNTLVSQHHAGLNIQARQPVQYRHVDGVIARSPRAFRQVQAQRFDLLVVSDAPLPSHPGRLAANDRVAIGLVGPGRSFFRSECAQRPRRDRQKQRRGQQRAGCQHDETRGARGRYRSYGRTHFTFVLYSSKRCSTQAQHRAATICPSLARSQNTSGKSRCSCRFQQQPSARC